MISQEDSLYTYEYKSYYKILPMIHNWHNDPMRIKDGLRVEEGFTYSSNNNIEWMSMETLVDWVTKNK